MEVSLILRLVDKMQDGLNKAKKRVQDFGDSVEKAVNGDKAAKNIGKIGEEAEKAFDKAGKAAIKAAEPIGNFSKETGRFYNEAGRAVGSFSNTIEGHYRRTNGVFTRMRRSMRDFFIELQEETAGGKMAAEGRFGKKNLEKRLKNLTEAARQARTEFLKAGAAAAPFLGFIHQAAGFDQTVKEFEKVTTNMAESRLEALKKFALKTSQEVAFSAEQILLLMKAAVQNGIPDQDLEKFSLFAARAGIAFDMSADDVSTAMAKLKNSFSRDGIAMTQEEIEDLGNTFNYLANNTASTAKELIDFTQRASSVSGTMKMTPTTIAAIGSAMISMGMPAEVAGTAFGTLGARIMAGSKQVRKGFNELGINRKKFIKDFEKDEQGTILKLFQRIKEKGNKGQEALIGIAGGQQFKNLAKLANNPEALVSAFKAINNKDARKDSVLNEAERQSSGASQQFKLLQNRLKAMSITIGEQLLPPVLELTKTLGDIVTRLTDWMQAHPDLTSAIVKTVAALVAFNVAFKAMKWLIAGSRLGLWRIAADFWKFDEAGRNIARRSGLLARSFRLLRGSVIGLGSGRGIIGSLTADLAGYSAAGRSVIANNRGMAGSFRKLLPLLKGGAMIGTTIGVDIANDFLQASGASDKWKNLGNLFADTVNGAMLGFIVGGPLGAAIAGIGAGLWSAIDADNKAPVANIDTKMAGRMADRAYMEQAEALKSGQGINRPLLEQIFGKEAADDIIKRGNMSVAETGKFSEKGKDIFVGKIGEFMEKGGKIALNPKDAENRGWDKNDPNLIYDSPIQGEQTALGQKLGRHGANIDAVIKALAVKAETDGDDLQAIGGPIGSGTIPVPTPKPGRGAVTNSNNTINQTITITIDGSKDAQAVARAIEAQLRGASAAALHGGG